MKPKEETLDEILGLTKPTMLEVLSRLPQKWFKLTEAEKHELERGIVMDKLARNTKFNL